MLLSHSALEVSGMGESFCDVTERLFGEFERVHRLPVIALVVGQCRVDLEGAPSGALPELVERLARQRLTDLAPSAAAGGPSRPGLRWTDTSPCAP